MVGSLDFRLNQLFINAIAEIASSDLDVDIPFDNCLEFRENRLGSLPSGLQRVKPLEIHTQSNNANISQRAKLMACSHRSTDDGQR